MAVYTVLKPLFIIFALAVPGVAFKKLNMADEHQLKLMSGFMLKVILPAIIIYSMQTEFSREVLESGIKVFLAVFLLFGCLFLFSVFFTRGIGLKKSYTGLVAFIMFFANTGGIGIPVMNMLFGSEAVFYASAAEMATDVLIFTAGVLLMKSSGEGNDRRVDIKALISPGTFGIVIGLVLFLTDTRLPEAVNGVLEKLSGASLPVTMFVIGAQIGGIELKTLRGDWRIIAVTAAKLIAAPAVMYVIAFFILKCDTIPAKVLTVLYAMPTGGAAAIFAQEYRADSVFAAKAVFLTDIFCLVTLPVLVLMI